MAVQVARRQNRCSACVLGLYVGVGWPVWSQRGFKLGAKAHMLGKQRGGIYVGITAQAQQQAGMGIVAVRGCCQGIAKALRGGGDVAAR
ncbi:MAG: hypothetical protein IPN06_12765 [Burkholderiales bacterium]|nr:hypothetical protein [Burkholderiales bacterium]